MAEGHTSDEDYWAKSYAKDYEDYILQLSILQLDTADRQVLKIAGGCPSIQLYSSTSMLLSTSL